MKIDIHTLLELEEQGLMKTRLCGSLRVACYSQKAQYEKLWNYHTLTCRGIVLEEENGDVVGMCLPKFFNLNETEETKLINLPWEQPYEIFDKVDGSLMTIFFYQGQVRFTTKCAFSTGYSLLADEYFGHELQYLYTSGIISKNITFSAEIRIPDDEESMRRVTRRDPGLYFFAAFNLDTGEELPFSYLEIMKDLYQFNLVEKYDWDLRELSETFYSHKDTEGYVVKFANGLRVKFKTAWYMYLNRLLEDMETKEKAKEFVKGMIRMYDNDSEWIANMPDELYDELTELSLEVRENFTKVYEFVKELDLLVLSTVPYHRTSRMLKTSYAEKIKNLNPQIKTALFLKYDGKPIDEYIWSVI